MTRHTWYCTRAGDHIHVRVFCEGASCGKLCFRDREFNDLADCFKPGAVELVWERAPGPDEVTRRVLERCPRRLVTG